MSYLKKFTIGLVISALSLSSVSFSYAGFEAENGKDHIVESGPSLMRVFANYEKEANFSLYNNTTIALYDSSSSTSKISGYVEPQILVATKRKGNWFYINTYLGKKWVYKDDNVELREIDNLSNTEYTTESELKLYSQPFTLYDTGITLPSGTYKISKKSGSWFYINTSEYNGWFYTTSGKFVGSISTLDTDNINGISLKTKIPNISNNVRPGTPMKPTYITIHNTDNTGTGANASSHANLLYNGNGGRTASWHFTVDDKEIYQSLPLDEIGYHAGDGSGPGNMSSIGIEICENKDGNYAKAEQNAVELTAYLLLKFDLPVSAVKKHQDFSGKLCPAKILGRTNGWNDFINRVQEAYDNMKQPEDIYHLNIHSFLGESNAQSALQQLQNDTGWYAEVKEMDQKEYYHNIRTGGFVGEDNAKNALQTVYDLTGLTGSYVHEGDYYGSTKTPIYRIETGGFIGEDNVKSALKWLQDTTGWWATYVPHESPNEYKIVTGGFVGEDNVKSALKWMQDNTGWWATYVANGDYYETEGTPIYHIYINKLLGESNTEQILNTLREKAGWWVTSTKTSDYISYYQIITGGFGGLENAQAQSEFVKNKYGWYNTLIKE